MTYKLNTQQYENVFTLPDSKRYYHFISRIVDWEEIWSLKTDEGWASVVSEERMCIPFWPHPKYAEYFARNNWEGYKPAYISLDDFIDKWLPGMHKDSNFAAVFPNQNMKGIVVEAYRVLESIKEEIDKY